MKSLWILMLLVLSSCATKKVYEKPSERFVDVTSSHRYANMYLSSFFCANKRWPKSLQELKQYTLPRRYRDGFNTQVNWHDISFMRMKYIPSSVILTAPEEKPGVPILTSVHSEPECSNGKIVSTWYEITKN